MDLTANAQAVLLLTAWFTKSDRNDTKPLTPSEWGRFAVWLKENDVLPEALLFGDVSRLLAGWQDKNITLPRIRRLLERGAALGLALEKWQRAGLWVIARSDEPYPTRLKHRLKAISPPVLFGCGNQDLLNKGGIAVIGSREAAGEELTFSLDLGESIARQGFSIISGGARGVDDAAMRGALESEGTVVGVLADSLLRAATSSRYRPGLMSGNLVLVSSVGPEADFEVGNAMARNKYIYCLADAAIVVAAGKGQGGTWNGAVENLRRGWVPLWVKPSADPSSGNAGLVEEGASWLPAGPLEVGKLCERPGAVPLNSSGAEPANAGLQDLTPKPRMIQASLFEEEK